ncbi:MAG: 1-acyl-sn-glycerol-3-phosphate acyltransferase [Actinomycetes bacterium]
MRGRRATTEGLEGGRTNGRARSLIWLCRVVVRVFMRQVDVTGRQHVPQDRPTILVCNHSNGLADPVVLIGCLGFFPRFLVAKSMWRIKGLSWLLRYAMCVPVARRNDVHGEAFDADTNTAAFAVCHEVLAAGGRVAVFPVAAWTTTRASPSRCGPAPHASP